MADSGRSPWVYVGCGCAALVLVFVIVIGVVSFYGYRFASEIKETMTDPEARRERVQQALGAERLPEGMNAQLYLAVPRVMQLVILSDGPAMAEDNARGLVTDFDRVFLYLKTRDFQNAKRDLERFLDGEVDRPAVFDDIDIDVDFDPEELLGRGAMQVGDQAVKWAAFRGEIDTDLERADGIMAYLGIDCPNDGRLRFGTWFQRAPRAKRRRTCPARQPTKSR